MPLPSFPCKEFYPRKKNAQLINSKKKFTKEFLPVAMACSSKIPAMKLPAVKNSNEVNPNQKHTAITLRKLHLGTSRFHLRILG